ncbi:DUF2878 domain-containing protein [Dokdonella sp.]|uniref:DUF2878 domain-containing protein n=1 Tax=Dokdonella sp. TaxID=2291710 RepID=UPI002F3EB40C
MGNLANIIGYQCVWFAAVLGASCGLAWAGPAAAAVFAAIELRRSPHLRLDAKLIATCLAVGVVVDGTMALGGIVRYASPGPALAAPVWILSIWVAFGLTLAHSLAFLQRRPWLAAVAGAAGGPLAYLGAARLGAVAFERPGLIAVAFAWTLAMPLLATCARDRRAVRERAA